MKIKLTNFIGFFLALSFLSFLTFNVITHSLEKNSLSIISFFLFNIILIIILPKLLPKNKQVSEIRNGFESFGKTLNKIIISIILFFVYFIGIGFTWAISRVIGKKFLRTKFLKISTWNTEKNKNLNFEEMF